jgi:hypothetical protein
MVHGKRALRRRRYRQVHASAPRALAPGSCLRRSASQRDVSGHAPSRRAAAEPLHKRPRACAARPAVALAELPCPSRLVTDQRPASNGQRPLAPAGTAPTPSEVRAARPRSPPPLHSARQTASGSPDAHAHAHAPPRARHRASQRAAARGLAAAAAGARAARSPFAAAGARAARSPFAAGLMRPHHPRSRRGRRPRCRRRRPSSHRPRRRPPRPASRRVDIADSSAQ